MSLKTHYPPRIHKPALWHMTLLANTKHTIAPHWQSLLWNANTDYISTLEHVSRNFWQMAAICKLLHPCDKQDGRMRTISKRRWRAFRMLTCPGNVSLVNGPEGVRVYVIDFVRKPRFQTKDATRNTPYTQLQPLPCWVRDQLNVPHSRRPWLSTTNIWRVTSTNIPRDDNVSFVATTSTTLRRNKTAHTCDLHASSDAGPRCTEHMMNLL